jgi:hypothetical protein
MLGCLGHTLGKQTFKTDQDCLSIWQEQQKPGLIRHYGDLVPLGLYSITLPDEPRCTRSQTFVARKCESAWCGRTVQFKAESGETMKNA